MTEEEEQGAAAAAKTKLTPEQQSAVMYWPTIAKIPIISCDSRNKGFSSSWKNGVDFSKIDIAQILLMVNTTTELR